MFEHQDTLNQLNKNLPLGEKLGSIHTAIVAQYDFIDRIAVAIYDPKTDLLKTYINSTNGESPLNRYQSPLAESVSLTEIVRLRKPRVVNDLNIFSTGAREHTQRIQEHKFASSYTMPMFMNDVLFFSIPARRMPLVMMFCTISTSLVTWFPCSLSMNSPVFEPCWPQSKPPTMLPTIGTRKPVHILTACHVTLA